MQNSFFVPFISKQGFCKSMQSEYPVIDRDPTIYKVVGLFRTIDYLTVVGGSVLSAGAMVIWNNSVPIADYRKTVRLAAAFGLIGGFMLAYQNSSYRLWGMSENAREVELHKTLKVKETVLDPQLASVAYRNTVNSQLLLSIVPMFNFVHHNKGVPESENQ